MRTPAVNDILRAGLSADRLQKYLLAKANDLDAAISLYERNSRLSEAFYIPLQTMEICLRNRINDALIAKYGPDWFANGKSGFDQDGVQKLNQAIRDLRQSRKPVTAGAVTAELSFGFWVAALGPRYDASIWRVVLYNIFREHGARMARKKVHGRFNALRRFRNRIAHHEPIFLIDLPRMHAEIIEATSWMCGETAAWGLSQSRFTTVFAQP